MFIFGEKIISSKNLISNEVFDIFCRSKTLPVLTEAGSGVGGTQTDGKAIGINRDIKGGVAAVGEKYQFGFRKKMRCPAQLGSEMDMRIYMIYGAKRLFKEMLV